MKQGFASWELRDTDVLTLGRRGCICPSAWGPATAVPPLIRLCLAYPELAGQGLSLHRQGSVWGGRRLG